MLRFLVRPWSGDKGEEDRQLAGLPPRATRVGHGGHRSLESGEPPPGWHPLRARGRGRHGSSPCPAPPPGSAPTCPGCRRSAIRGRRPIRSTYSTGVGFLSRLPPTLPGASPTSPTCWLLSRPATTTSRPAAWHATSSRYVSNPPPLTPPGHRGVPPEIQAAVLTRRPLEPPRRSERTRYGACFLLRRGAAAVTVRTLADGLPAGDGEVRDATVLGDLNDEPAVATTAAGPVAAHPRPVRDVRRSAGLSGRCSAAAAGTSRTKLPPPARPHSGRAAPTASRG